MNSHETGGQIVPPRAPERAKALSWSLQEVASSGAYIVSAKTVEALQQVLDVLATTSAPGGDFYQDLSKRYDAADEALKIVREEAHRDLGVKEKRQS